MKAFILSLNPEANLLEQWDFGFLSAFLKGDLWQTNNWVGFDIKSCQKLSKCEKAIVAIPARHHKGLEEEINHELRKIDKVVLFLMGDEEADFDVDKISHPSITIWVQNPHMDKHDKYKRIGTGFPPHFKKYLDDTIYPDKETDIYFSGQVTHDRRIELVEALIEMYSKYKIDLLQTEGFTQGESHDVYAKKMSQAKIAPCPSGAVIQDSFRLFEALEAMAVPIADQKTPSGRVDEYWDWLFKDITPFPKLSDFEAMKAVVPEILNDYARLQHKITAWYINYKRNFAYEVMKGLQ